MSARDEAVEMIRRICPPHLGRNEYGRILAEKFDAHRAEVLTEAKIETVAWLVKKARENTPVGELASKVDRGAVRAFIGTAHYRGAMDAHRAEVTVEVLRGAVESVTEIHRRCHRTVCAACKVRRDILDVLRSVADVIGEKATAGAATATPDFFQPGHKYHLGHRHTFLCTSIDLNPGTGERHAIGWAYDTHTDRWRVTDLTGASWRGGWVDATEAGDL